MLEATRLVILYLFLLSLGNSSKSWFQDWPFWSGNSPHSLSSHVHVPPHRSVCDKMMFWLEMLGHNNSYSCQPLPSDIHGVYNINSNSCVYDLNFSEILPQFCSIAGLETFNHCQQNQEAEACLMESLQVFIYQFYKLICLHYWIEHVFSGCWREFWAFPQMLVSWLCWELCCDVDNLENDVWGTNSLSWSFTSSCWCCRKIWTIPSFRYFKDTYLLPNVSFSIFCMPFILLYLI